MKKFEGRGNVDVAVEQKREKKDKTFLLISNLNLAIPLSNINNATFDDHNDGNGSTQLDSHKLSPWRSLTTRELHGKEGLEWGRRWKAEARTHHEGGSSRFYGYTSTPLYGFDQSQRCVQINAICRRNETKQDEDKDRAWTMQAQQRRYGYAKPKRPQAPAKIPNRSEVIRLNANRGREGLEEEDQQEEQIEMHHHLSSNPPKPLERRLNDHDEDNIHNIVSTAYAPIHPLNPFKLRLNGDNTTFLWILVEEEMAFSINFPHRAPSMVYTKRTIMSTVSTRILAVKADEEEGGGIGEEEEKGRLPCQYRCVSWDPR
ncbi:hypothetical protein FB446DRAFT_707691 [Lentinula raphanica]|nr:hypothetical protein FB446DRAFT_707691 [Lentinula raphanica]